MRSIRRELLVWLLLGIALADEANALFDYQLKEMAASLTDAPFAAVPAGVGTIGAGSDAMVVQIWDRNGVQLFLSQPRRVLPQNAQLGFTTLSTESGPWRVFSALAAEQVVQIAQPMSARRELAASMALRTIIPLLAVLPFLAVLIWFTIARGLKPLDRVAEEADIQRLTIRQRLRESADGVARQAAQPGPGGGAGGDGPRGAADGPLRIAGTTATH